MCAPSTWQNGRIRAPASISVSLITQWAPMAAPSPNVTVAFEYTVHVDAHVLAANQATANIDALRVGQRHALCHQLCRLLALIEALELRELMLGIDT